MQAHSFYGDVAGRLFSITNQHYRVGAPVEPSVHQSANRDQHETRPETLVRAPATRATASATAVSPDRPSLLYRFGGTLKCDAYLSRTPVAASIANLVNISSSALVAGVVGKNKFAYDIWGDAVNIASRIETSGEPGKINLSKSTFDLVKGEYECEHRGKVHAKNKGDIDMYFVKL